MPTAAPEPRARPFPPPGNLYPSSPCLGNTVEPQLSWKPLLVLQRVLSVKVWA